jgi:uncharacterized protein (TIGR03067 family)
MKAPSAIAISALVLLTTTCLPLRAQDDAARKDLQSLEGTWIPTALATAEGPKPLNSTKVEKIVIKGMKWVMHEQGKQFEYSFTIDPATKPKAMDSTGTFNGQTTKSLCVYEVNGDTLRFANGGSERPSSFDRLPPGGVLFIFKRAKP